MIGKELRWKAGRIAYPTQQGGHVLLPRSTATTRDQRTAIEIIGPPNAMRQISLVGEMPSAAPARQAATYAALVLRLIAPEWSDADAWLASALQWVREAPTGICVDGWQVTITWSAAARTLILKAVR